MNYKIQIIPDDPLELLSDETEEIILPRSIVAAIIAEHKKQLADAMSKIRRY